MQWVHNVDKSFPVSHTTLYNVHQRIANNYREGRVFLAGDAAHINNPLGGMGMNGGVHDAFNLAEKLSAVWHNKKSETILDLYDKQRRSVALDYVNKQSIKNKKNLEAKSPEEQQAFRSFLSILMDSDKKAKKYLMKVSMLESLRNTDEML